MPSVIVDSVGVADGSTTSPLDTSQWQYMPFNALVHFGIWADTGDTFTLSVYSGSDVLLQASPMPILVVGTAIEFPQHYYLEDVVGAGERLGITALNGTGAVATFRTHLRIFPI